MRGIRIFKWTFLILGLTFIAFTILVVVNTRNLIARADTAQGTVVRMLSDRDGYTPVVRFRTAKGKEITFEELGKEKPAPYAIGDRVQVLYPPQSPRNARIDSYSSLWGLPTIVGILGVAFATAGGGMFLYGMLGKRKKEHLLAYGNAVETEFQGVERNGALEFNGKNPWRISSQWVNPATDKLRIFYSENLWFDPTRFVTKKQLTVLLDPEKPERYYMDISFLPKLDGDA